MSLYESVIVSRQDISKNQIDNLIDEFSEIIKSSGGSVNKVEYWGLRNLAYEINKNKKAHYNMIVLESSPDIIEEFERKMRIHEDIIRYMTIKIKNFNENPSILAENSEEDSIKDAN